MKALRILGLVLVLAAAITSCKKDNVSKGNKAAEGMWVGKWGDGSEDPSYYYRLELKPGGTLNRYDDENNVIATGTWTVNGIEFIGQYTMTHNGFKASVKGLYHDIVGEITGTWGETPSYANGGTFDLKKQ